MKQEICNNGSVSNQHQYQELIVLTKAKLLAKCVYEFCKNWLPESERFGLWSQMTRCGVSIASNIAEGQQRGNKEFIHFLQISRGSLFELKTQLEICQMIGYCGVGETGECNDLIDEVGKLTYGLINKLKGDSK